MFGKQIRIERILDRTTGRAVIVPMDHGLSKGPIFGLTDMKDTVRKVAEGGATAVLMHKGMVQFGHRGFGNDVGLIIHLSAGTEMGSFARKKVIVTSVEEALTLGADAVSIHITLGTNTEPEMLKSAGEVSADCRKWGVPLLAMVYPGEKDLLLDVDAIRHCGRVAAELGADIVKTPYTGDTDTFREVVKSAGIPVLIAGGPMMNSDIEMLRVVRDSLDAGGKGVSIGRNIFQHKNITGVTRAVSKIVLEDADLKTALLCLEDK